MYSFIISLQDPLLQISIFFPPQNKKKFRLQRVNISVANLTLNNMLINPPLFKKFPTDLLASYVN